MKIMKKMRGAMIRCREMPADFRAISSEFSPRFPKVMMLASRIARGRAIGTRLADTYISSSVITVNDNPLPASSSIHFQRNCMRRMKIVMKKVRINGGMKDAMMNR